MNNIDSPYINFPIRSRIIYQNDENFKDFLSWFNIESYIGHSYGIGNTFREYSQRGNNYIFWRT